MLVNRPPRRRAGTLALAASPGRRWLRGLAGMILCAMLGAPFAAAPLAAATAQNDAEGAR
jgi:hypothetical protein